MTTTIPVRIELAYMAEQRRLLRELEFYTIASLSKRTDSEELLAWLDMNTPQVLDKAKLRRKLNLIARNITAEKLKELSALLGRPLELPNALTLANWVNEQVEAVQFTVEHWLLEASEEIRNSQLRGMPYAEMTAALRTKAKKIGGIAEQRASLAILQLNSQLIEEIARAGGSTHYRWQTEADSRVRPNHSRLHMRVYSWDDPPAGGGTKSGDSGHPGSGYGCRCTAIPLQGGRPIVGIQNPRSAPDTVTASG